MYYLCISCHDETKQTMLEWRLFGTCLCMSCFESECYKNEQTIFNINYRLWLRTGVINGN